jgi:hypothetical protein
VQWARSARTWVAQKKLSRGTDQVEKLTDGCLGAFHAISERLDVQEISLNTIDQRDQRVEARLQRVEDGMHAILNMLQARPPVNNQLAGAAGIVEETKEEGKEEGTSFCLLRFLILLLILTHLVVLVPDPPQRQVNDVLLARSRAPNIEAALPKTLILLRAEWVSKNLADFVPHQSWGNLKAAWIKRKYVMDDMKRRRMADGGSLVEASEAVERDRLAADKTVYQWWELLKARDPLLFRRVRRREADPNETPPRPRRRRRRHPPPPPPVRRAVPPTALAPPLAPPPQVRRTARAWQRTPPMPYGMPAGLQPIQAVNWARNVRTSGRGRGGMDDLDRFA